MLAMLNLFLFCWIVSPCTKYDIS